MAADNVIPLSRFRADISKSGASKRRELFNAPDPQAAIQALDPIELYALAADAGEADSFDLMALASAEQVRVVVDLAAFDKDELPDFKALEKWFAAAVAHGPGSATVFFEKLDEELQTLYLARRLRIYEARGETQEEIPDDDADRYLTPDGGFVVALAPADDEDASPADAPRAFSAFQLVADLYAVDWRRADLMLRDAKWTIASELEETLARLRRARLEDAGFPAFDEAMRMYTRLREGEALPARPAPTGERRRLPARYAEAFLSDAFLVQVLSGVHDDTLLGQLEAELMFLVNAEAIVTRADLGAIETTHAAAETVRATLSLGLELFSNGDVGAARAGLEKHPLRGFFQLALTQVYKLKDWAHKALQQKLFHLPPFSAPFLSGDDAAFLNGLTRRLPRLVEDAASPPKAFASRAEIARAQKRLERMASELMAAKWLLRPAGDDLAPAFAGCTPAAEQGDGRLLLRALLVRRAIGASVKDTVGVSPADLRAFFRAHAAGDAEPAFLREAPAALAPIVEDAWQALVGDVRAAGEAADPAFLDLVVKTKEPS